MEQATLDRIYELIELKRETDTELEKLVVGTATVPTDKPPRKKWTKKTTQPEVNNSSSNAVDTPTTTEEPETT